MKAEKENVWICAMQTITYTLLSKSFYYQLKKNNKGPQILIHFLFKKIIISIICSHQKQFIARNINQTYNKQLGCMFCQKRRWSFHRTKFSNLIKSCRNSIYFDKLISNLKIWRKAKYFLEFHFLYIAL